MTTELKKPAVIKLCAEWARVVMLDSFHDTVEAMNGAKNKLTNYLAGTFEEIGATAAVCVALAAWNRRAAPPAPEPGHRERAEAFDRNYSGEPSGEPFRIALAAEFAAVAEEARPKPNSTDKAVVDALIDRHKGLPGSSDEWCICLSDQFRHDLEVIMAAVREAATKAERERCAKAIESEQTFIDRASTVAMNNRYGLTNEDTIHSAWVKVVSYCAAAIRGER